MPPEHASIAVVLLAGGSARRFPGKLEHSIGGRPLLARSYANVRAAGWPVYLAGAGSFARELDAALDAPLLIDRYPGQGPLHAFLDACTAIRAQRLYAVAADQPRVDAAVLACVARAWQKGDEAVVPEHSGRSEPLAALYDRRAVLREAFGLRTRGRRAMHDLVEALAVRLVRIDDEYFCNVNRPQDLAALERPG